jgi:glycosyltransferase involved in cell wall biosynthesis
MRIGMMADAYKPKVSGVTSTISLSKCALEAAGHKVFIFTFGGEDFEDDELNVVRTPGLPLSDTGFYFSFRFSRHARRKLQTMDIVHVHHPFLSGRLAIRYCKPYNIPIVFTNHTRYDLLTQAYFPLLPDEVGNTLLQAYLPSFCREVDLLIAPSLGLCEILRGFGVECPIEVIPNGVDLGPFRNPAHLVSRESLGFGPDEVLMVYVGRLGPEKNLAFLIRAFAGVHTAYPEARLLLVGDGPEHDNLRDQVTRSGLEGLVQFTGMIGYDKLPSFYALGDIFVTASVSEVHPLTVIEALASGLPVMGIRSPGVGDIITDGLNGVLSEHDLAAFTARLSRLVADGETRRRLAQQARQSSEQYAIERTTAVLEQQYARLVADKPRSRQRNWRLTWQRLVDRVT